jgi:hypothetical protein
MTINTPTVLLHARAVELVNELLTHGVSVDERCSGARPTQTNCGASSGATEGCRTCRGMD